MSSLAEPGLFLTVFVVSLTFGGTNLTSLVGAAARSGVVIAPSMLFGLIAFFIITLAETGRLPFDNPATHLELTMVHEAMVLEYSGRSLALIQWSQSIKQLLLLGLMVDLFLPLGMPTSVDAGLPLLGLGAAAVLVKVVVLAMARRLPGDPRGQVEAVQAAGPVHHGHRERDGRDGNLLSVIGEM